MVCDFRGGEKINLKHGGMKKVRIIVYLALLSNFVFGQCAISTNLVSNGNFESGNSGFTSNYTYSSGDLWSEGTFDVISDPSGSHSNFAPCSGAGGSGLMMVVNGSMTANAEIWCQTVTVEAGADYTFSTEITSVHPANPAILQFSINSTNLGTPFAVPSATCSWNTFCESWNSGVATSADICIVNQNTTGSGNDFAIDNVQMGKVLTPLPVILKRFNAYNENADVRIEWTALLEDEHDRYEIERSLDGVNWLNIGYTSGTMIYEDSLEYVFYDHLPQEGLNFYRLKFVAVNGSVEYSKTVEVLHEFFSVNIVEAYPNPANQQIHLKINERIESVSLMNHMGKMVFSRSNPSGSETISLVNLASGTYYINFKDSKGKLYNKLFVKQ